MLVHEIPTHLNSRDALLWGLTAAELVIVVMGLVSVYLVLMGWGLPWPPPLRPLVVGWTVAQTGALVLWRPYDRRIDAWAVLFVRFLLSPRRLIYRPIGGLRP